MARAAAYTRVSTEKQAEDDKVSLGEQTKDIELTAGRRTTPSLWSTRT